MLDDATTESLVEEYGSPLYVYDLDEAGARVDALRDFLPPDSDLFYSLKANPLPALVSAFREAGCRADVSSPGEMRVALEAGVRSADLLYTGPGKSPAEIESAVRHGVKTFSCESANEIARLDAAATRLSTRLDVLLRLNAAHAVGAGLHMGGRPTQFGMSEQSLVRLAADLAGHGRLRVTGLHVFLGTQVEAVPDLLENFRGALEAAERLSTHFDRPFEVLDLGGGFAWPFGREGVGADLSASTDEMHALSDTRVRTKGTRLWFESGRYLAASCGTLLTRVMDVKVGTGEATTYVVLDAGINHLGGMSGLGRILRPSITPRIISRVETPFRQNVEMVGPLCSPLDRVASGLVVAAAPGDLVQIPNVGAYGLTASLVHFLSRDPPVEVALRNGRPATAYRIRTGHELHGKEL